MDTHNKISPIYHHLSFQPGFDSINKLLIVMVFLYLPD